MSHSDANFRNSGTENLTTLQDDPGRVQVNNVPINLYLPPFLAINCGVTIEADLVSWGIKSFFRTPNLVSNQAYYAREVAFRFDTPGTFVITITSTEFAPYGIVVRSGNTGDRWTTVGGVVVVNVSAGQTGPFTLEVTSVQPYATGHFTVTMTCNPATYPPPTPGYHVWLRAYQYFDHASQIVLNSSNFQTKWQALRTAVNAYDMSTLTSNVMSVFKWDGASFSNKVEKPFPVEQYFDLSSPGASKAVTLWGGLAPVAIYDDTTLLWVGNEYYLFCERFVGYMPFTDVGIYPTQFPYSLQLIKEAQPASVFNPGSTFFKPSGGYFSTDPLDHGQDFGLMDTGAFGSTILSTTTNQTNPSVDLQLPDITSSTPNFYLYRTNTNVDREITNDEIASPPERNLSNSLIFP